MRLSLIGLAILGLSATAEPALAVSCERRTPPLVAAEFVVVGKVEAVEAVSTEPSRYLPAAKRGELVTKKSATVRAIESLKGANPPESFRYTFFHGPMVCGPVRAVRPGDQLIFALVPDPRQGEWRVSIEERREFDRYWKRRKQIDEFWKRQERPH